MPREREFDEGAVLTNAMDAFRSHGFMGTSVRALEHATGLTTGSLYNGFGGKARFFERALEHYCEKVVLGRLRRHLCAKRSPRDEVEALFRSTFEGPEADGHGCLLTTASSEASALSAAACALVERGFAAQRSAFFDALGRVAPVLRDRERKQRAEVLLASYHGVLVLVRQGQPKKTLRSMTDAVLTLVFP